MKGAAIIRITLGVCLSLTFLFATQFPLKRFQAEINYYSASALGGYARIELGVQAYKNYPSDYLYNHLLAASYAALGYQVQASKHFRDALLERQSWPNAWLWYSRHLLKTMPDSPYLPAMIKRSYDLGQHNPFLRRRHLLLAFALYEKHKNESFRETLDNVIRREVNHDPQYVRKTAYRYGHVSLLCDGRELTEGLMRWCGQYSIYTSRCLDDRSKKLHEWNLCQDFKAHLQSLR